MSFQDEVFHRNRQWAKAIKDEQPDFFDRLSAQQSPEILWIGCSDSRVPANEITGMMPGEIFVHRNIANLVLHADMNCQSVIQYAVQVLKVKHVVVCGHYGCGGIKAATNLKNDGLIQNWLRNITDIYDRHLEELETITDGELRGDRLCELNVIAQVKNLASSNPIQNAWSVGQDIAVHGWIYSIRNGLLKDLDVDASGVRDIAPVYRTH